jgi:hypothetical protein
MPRVVARLIALALVSVSLLAAGCSRAGASPTPSESAPAVAPTEPRATTPPTIEPTLEPSPADSPVAEPQMAEPPPASIAVEGGDPVIGQLGTFTWGNSGSDAPWLNGSPMQAGQGERLTMTLAEPVTIGAWSVSRVPPGNRDGIGAVMMQEGSEWPLSFEAPPAGQWSVEVSVRFADNRGAALYFWMIEVD